MTTQASVEGFLAEQTLAIAGVSRSGKGFGNAVFKDLAGKGYEVLPVHPQADEIAGARAYHSLADLPNTVGRVWMQQGAESSEAIRYCRENGIEAVHGECIMMFAQPTGVHRFHRWINGVFGKLPSTES
jgi:predicted CoA-binding protein